MRNVGKRIVCSDPSCDRELKNLVKNRSEFCSYHLIQEHNKRRYWRLKGVTK